jgi:hypothetical protein
MKIKVVFIYSAILLAIFGLLFVFIPSPALSLFAITLDDQGYMMVRLFGAALVGLALIAWMARDDPPSRARQAIVWGECIESIIAVVVLLVGIFSGIGNTLAWVPVVVHLLIALGFGYFLVTKSS